MQAENIKKEDTIRSVISIISGIPDGAEACVLADRLHAGERAILHVCRDDARMQRTAESLAFFAPEAEILTLPAWDCLPYDRVSPHHSVITHRIETLAALANPSHPYQTGKPTVLLTTVNALIQRLPPRDSITDASYSAHAGDEIDREALTRYLVSNGYSRVSKVMEQGEFAIRGAIVDIFPPGSEEGLRLDFFGDTLESIRTFDPLSQVSQGSRDVLQLLPAGEILLHDQAISRFRTRYRELFGSITKEDPLYEAVKEGRKYPGMEHWLPLFYERMDTVFDYFPADTMTFDHLAAEAYRERQDTIADYYAARKTAQKEVTGGIYHPLPPEYLYLSEKEWQEKTDNAQHFSPFKEAATDLRSLHGEAESSAYQKARDFGPERNQKDRNVFDAVAAHIRVLQESGQTVFIACFSEGSRDRLTNMLQDHGVATAVVDAWPRSLREGRTVTTHVGMIVLALDHGFYSDQWAILSEQDILGDRITRTKKKKRRPEEYLAEASNFSEGELVVHKDHGIGRFEGLVAVEASGAAHDCLKLIYDGGDRLFVPVENIEVITRYGADEGEVTLDKLGGVSWQKRKAALKQRIRLAASELLKIAAEREMKPATPLKAPSHHYEEFCARFPYAETEDQDRAIEETLQDLADGRPMNRLICGDAGFGKTEVALRAAFAAVSDSHERRQVAVVVPTTLLARQHYANFKQRFKGIAVEATTEPLLPSRGGADEARLKAEAESWGGETDTPTTRSSPIARSHALPHQGGAMTGGNSLRLGPSHEQTRPVSVRQLSRLVTPKEADKTRDGIRDGSIDIVIGTHALLAKDIRFKNLGLLIVDEEQHFGVKQKEQLKKLKADVHVLSMSATPIPRTLQLALAGVRELSLITTPPVDRLAVRTFVMPFDPVVIREALLREHYRGGKSFFVAPRIKDLDEIAPKLKQIVPEVKFAVAHGQMPAAKLDEIMTAFDEGKFDVLLSTAIVESGLDIPSANTMIIHRADMFGLGQLYQMRGRVGRGKIRAYAYLTLPPGRKLSKASQKRLEVMQTLDTLGVGFSVASHDMDIRGFGNLLGDEQSGHVKEVGVELYQQLLTETIDALRRGEGVDSEAETEGWTPEINLGVEVLIPDDYVEDISLRLGLYRRLAGLASDDEIEQFAVELVDRFGPIPPETENLLTIARLKRLCRQAGIERLDAGPRGFVITFHDNTFANPEALMQWIAGQPATAKLRPDQKLVLTRDLDSPEKKLKGAGKLLEKIVGFITQNQRGET